MDQLQIFDAVRALLMRRSEQSPVVVVLEDLHWADRSTRDLVAFLVRTMWSGRVTLVASYRSDELHRRHPLRVLLAELVRLPGVERIELAPFSRVELTEHLESVAGASLPPDRVARIHDRSEGNAFYAEQLLASGAGDAEAALPPTLADVVLARVHALPEPAQQVLGVAAVAGRRVPHHLLAQVAGWPEPDLEQALRAAIAAGVLVADQTTATYVFRHALLQEAVYGDLLPGEQVRLHAAYARLLAEGSEGSAAELAHHCLQSHDLVGALAASVRAADEAAAVLAPAETLRHLTGVIKLWERVPDPIGVTGTDRVELTLRAAAAANAAGDPQRAVALAQDAAAMAEQSADSAWAARAYERLGMYLQHAGRGSDALRARARAVELVPPEPPSRLRARVTAAMAQALINNGRPDEARRWCNDALAVARAVGSAEDEADVLITLSIVEWSDPPKASSLLAAGRARAVDAGRPEVELRAVHNLAGLELALGNLVTARAVFDEGAELADRSGLGWSWLGVAMRREQLLVRYQEGDWDDSERLAAAIPDLAPTLAVAELGAGALPVEVGHGRATVPKRLRDLAALSGVDLTADVEVAALEADHAAWQGDLDQAGSAIRRGLAIVDASQFRVFQGEYAVWICAIGLAVQAGCAEGARALGDAVALTDAIAAGRVLPERAHAAAERAKRIGHAHDVSLVGWLAKAEAEWTRLEGRSDSKAWQAAVEAFSYGHVYEVARCQWRLAEALLGGGDREQATVVARAAHQAAVRLEATPLRAALEALARRARLDLGERVGRAPRTAGLTPRELEVLRLLAAGGPTGRSPRACSSAARPPVCTSPTSWQSLGCTAAWRPPPAPATWVLIARQAAGVELTGRPRLLVGRTLGVSARQPCRGQHDAPAQTRPGEETLLRGDPLGAADLEK